MLSCPVWDAFNAQRVQKERDYHVYKEKTNVCEDEESTSTEDGDAESPVGRREERIAICDR